MIAKFLEENDYGASFESGRNKNLINKVRKSSGVVYKRVMSLPGKEISMERDHTWRSVTHHTKDDISEITKPIVTQHRSSPKSKKLFFDENIVEKDDDEQNDYDDFVSYYDGESLGSHEYKNSKVFVI